VLSKSEVLHLFELLLIGYIKQFRFQSISKSTENFVGPFTAWGAWRIFDVDCKRESDSVLHALHGWKLEVNYSNWREKSTGKNVPCQRNGLSSDDIVSFFLAANGAY